MPTFIALIRGINVGGNTLKMERVREVLIHPSEVKTPILGNRPLFQANRFQPRRHLHVRPNSAHASSVDKGVSSDVTRDG